MTIILSNGYIFLNVTYGVVPCNKLLKKKKKIKTVSVIVNYLGNDFFEHVEC